uniref:Uncharacterized protein n=1 Tax=Clastoptera arizonana TaxID=38151 RepID=A0A1B6CF15_9HEMI
MKQMMKSSQIILTTNLMIKMIQHQNILHSHKKNLSILKRLLNKVVLKKTVPVCFSIKKPKEVDKLEHLSALPLEESSGGEGSHSEDDDSHKDDKAHKGNRKSKSHSSTKSKWVEERVKDKLAHAAKGKLALKEREKQLQIERKKRALAFLNRLRKENSSPVKGSYPSSGRSESSFSKGKSSVVYISSGHSSEDDSSCRGLSSKESDHNKTRASQTLQRILGAVPKNNRDDKKLLHEISSTSRSYYSKSRNEYSSKHNHHHHKRHKRHYYDDDYKSMSKHKKKSHKRHKSNKRSPSVEYVVIE